MTRTSRRSLAPAAAAILPLLFFAAQAWAAPAAKVKVCHVPPGDPSNFHTITVSENALSAHLAHGDLAGECSDFCETLCNDGDACTVDGCGDRGCTYSAVDCDDGNACTEDELCNPQTGCLNDPLPQTPCDDGNDCTISDSCDDTGTCAGESVEGCCLSADDCDDGRSCTDDSCVVAPGEVAGTCINEDVVCESPDLCFTAACDEVSAACVFTEITCTPSDQCHDEGICDPDSGDCSNPAKPDGSPCDDGDPGTQGEGCVGGVCTPSGGTTACPCLVQPGWETKLDVVTAAPNCTNFFFPQTYVALASGQGAVVALFNAGSVLCQWQNTGSTVSSLMVPTTLAEFQACQAIMTCGG